MSTKKPILAAALTVLGLMGLASADAADPQASEPSTRTSPAIAPGEPNEAEAASTAGAHGVILLTDGQVVQGTVVQDDTGYLIKTPYGSKRFPKGRIEKSFQTVREAYEYKLSQFPDEDTDERLKLAQWCLAQNLQDEAKVQLQGILKINPKHPPAKAMLEKIEQAEVTKAKRRFDPNIQQAKATSEDMTDAGGPKELDPSALARPNPRPLALSPADVPDIFNLPRPKALKLMEQFNQTIHPVLQNSCAKCHNDRYPGNFQLRQVRNRRELNRDTLKVNLEATLQLIDPSTPAKSELLSSSLRPHGYGKTKRPIFKGSSDPSYRKIAEWVDSVCKPMTTDGLSQASAQAGLADGQESFAVERALNLGEPQTPITPHSRQIQAGAAQAPVSRAMNPPNRTPVQAGRDPADFPLTDISHAATSLKSSASVRIPHTKVAEGSASSEKGPSKSNPQSDVESTDLPELPPDAAAPPATKKKPKTPVKIDPALLERALKARNGGN